MMKFFLIDYSLLRSSSGVYSFIRETESAHGDKCTHNQYVCLYSRFTSQKAGKHGYALLRKDIREISVTASGV